VSDVKTTASFASLLAPGLREIFDAHVYPRVACEPRCAYCGRQRTDDDATCRGCAASEWR
jgi:hypothetical protein